jgi:hypothetical protein
MNYLNYSTSLDSLFLSSFLQWTANLCYHRTLGRFHSVRQSGLQLKIPLIDRVAGRVNLKIQLDVIIETKTKIRFLWNLKFLCNYGYQGNRLWCFYKLEYAHDQITYVFDVVRAEVPKLKPMMFWKKRWYRHCGKSELMKLWLLMDTRLSIHW